ncbi:MAG: glycosyltransferase family 4 protein [Balneolaceae bacterium]|nr:glycosyltransferase family 4 protein [Balneolaceae bacterium]
MLPKRQWISISLKRAFIVKGRAESAEKVVGNARVLLAPLRFGAGIKGKLIEAMQCGTPSVTTTIGAEGINGKMDWPGAIADDPQAFAEAAIHIFSDQTEWDKAQQQGAEIINKRFLRKLFENKLVKRIQKSKEGLSAHRRQNFIGQMLLHHTMRSTEFMSRWIEEKNK